MQSASDTGVMSWVTSGRLDLVADIRFPREDDQDLDLSALVADLVDDLAGRLSNKANGGGREGERIPGRTSLTRDALKVPSDDDVSEVGRPSREGFREKERRERRKALLFARAIKSSEPGDDEEVTRKFQESIERLEKRDRDGHADDDDDDDDEDKIVSIDLDLRFKDLKAHVPVRLFLSLSLALSLFPAFARRKQTKAKSRDRWACLTTVFHVQPVVRQQRVDPSDRRLHQQQSHLDPDPLRDRPRPERVQRVVDDVRRRDPRAHVGAGLLGARAPRRVAERREDPDGRPVDAPDDGQRRLVGRAKVAPLFDDHGQSLCASLKEKRVANFCRAERVPFTLSLSLSFCASARALSFPSFLCFVRPSHRVVLHHSRTPSAYFFFPVVFIVPPSVAEKTTHTQRGPVTSVPSCREMGRQAGLLEDAEKKKSEGERRRNVGV